MNIVVRAPNWVGDCVLAFPFFESLGENFPDAKIWIASKPRVKDLFLSYNFIKGTILLPLQNDFMSLRNAAREIRRCKFDIGLILPNSFSAVLLFYLAKIRQRWGYQRDGRGVLLTRGVIPKDQEESIHQVHYYLGLLSGLGFQTQHPELKLALTQEEKKEAQGFLSSMNVDRAKPLIIFHPGAAYGPAKRWPAHKYAELARLFQERKGATILIIGSEDEGEVAESVSFPLGNKPLNLAGKTTLRLLAGLISQATLFVSNDSGPMHIANALRIPVIALFGPTDPLQTGPFQQPASVIKKDVACWPCTYRECPYDHRCMMGIEAEEVFEICQRFLG